MGIPASELAAMQTAMNALLDQTALLQHNTLVATTYGTQTDSWNAGTTVPCNVAKPSANLAQQYADKIGALAAWVIRLPYGTNIHPQDQLTINGVVMRVNALLTPRSFPVAIQVLAVEVE